MARVRAMHAPVAAFRSRDTRDEHHRRLWAAAKAKLEAEGVRDPTLGLFSMQLDHGFKPSTFYQYSANIVRLHPQDFNSTPELQRYTERILQNLKRESKLAPADQAEPASPEQVRALIGDLSTPEQQCVYRLWVTASRWGDQDGWEIHLPQPHEYQAVQVRVRFSKTDMLGEHPRNKWVFLHSAAERAWWTFPLESVLPPRYASFLSWLKAREEDLSCHSFRRGAMHYLQQLGYNEPQMTLLSHHALEGHQHVSGVGKYVAMHCLTDPGVEESLVMAERLRQAVLPTLTALVAPPRPPGRK